MKRASMLGLVTLALVTAVGAIPPPEPLTDYAQRSDLVLVGTVGDWNRTTWFWQRPKRYEAQVDVERVLQGQHEGTSLLLRIEVHPDTDGGELTGTPRSTRRLLFLRKAGDAYAPIDPAPYAFQDPSDVNISQVATP